VVAVLIVKEILELARSLYQPPKNPAVASVSAPICRLCLEGQEFAEFNRFGLWHDSSPIHNIHRVAGHKRDKIVFLNLDGK
jgi:hypothetical protein